MNWREVRWGQVFGALGVVVVVALLLYANAWCTALYNKGAPASTCYQAENGETVCD